MPCKCPAGYFLTKIFHPNVSKSGEICVNVLKKDWKADLGLRHVLVIIRWGLLRCLHTDAVSSIAFLLLPAFLVLLALHGSCYLCVAFRPPTVSSHAGPTNKLWCQKACDTVVAAL